MPVVEDLSSAPSSSKEPSPGLGISMFHWTKRKVRPICSAALLVVVVAIMTVSRNTGRRHLSSRATTPNVDGPPVPLQGSETIASLLHELDHIEEDMDSVTQKNILEWADQKRVALPDRDQTQTIVLAGRSDAQTLQELDNMAEDLENTFTTMGWDTLEDEAPFHAKRRVVGEEDPALEQNVPVQHYKDDKVPGAAASYIQHAADSLLCRKSVVNFVINATDGKDECEGLKKAFDKTCSNDRRRLKNSRSIWDKMQYTNRIQLFVLQHVQYAWKLAKFLFERQPLFFFAEDEVEAAYDDALGLVQRDLDDMIQPDLRRHWQQERQSRRLEEVDIAEEPLIETNATDSIERDDPVKPRLSLDLPTQNQHLSDKVLSETYLLHQGDKVFEKAANQSAKQNQEAKEDAAKSSKAMSDTNAAVSALLNDPSSVEARTCCASILNVYHENCSTHEEEQISDSRLFFVVLVMALCGMVKSLIRFYKIVWLPEAAGCIVVGVLSGYVLMLFPHSHDLSFDGNWFLRILVPPIIFEAALSINKRSFNRHIVPILLYAIAGTLFATCVTAYIVHRATTMMSPYCTPIPYVEALTFGALISSIDPIAVLSVLSNMGMTDTDTIYVIIFGESLLNDGVAIVLFHTLVHFLDETVVIDREAVLAGAVHFFIVAFGSLLIGIASGMLSTVYFWLFHGCQTPLVEVLMFFCWALTPYYVCDGIGWSGIVSAVAVGFVMDLHIVGQNEVVDDSEDHGSSLKTTGLKEARIRRQIFSPFGHLSDEARQHIGFVTEIISTTMETAIFAYLGLFLFSHRYHWNLLHTVVAIFACCTSRGLMIPILSFFANWITRFQQNRTVSCVSSTGHPMGKANSSTAGVVIDGRMQIVLWFAGLRGAMSFALVEHIPLFDSVSGEGTRLKPELKAMTSATIMFTVFILGGYTYYMMESLGLTPSPGNNKQGKAKDFEMIALVNQSDDEHSHTDNSAENEFPAMPNIRHVNKQAFRRKQHSGMSME